MDTSKTYPRDVFLYLLSIITLITITITFGVLLFQYINIQFPDSLTENYYYSKTAIYDAIRTSMAMLFVIFPVFVWTSWFLRKDLNNHPEKKDYRIRRWLLYLTLFAASLVIIGDLVALLMSFLNGELSVRFILKVLAVLLIAGAAFIHYLSELRERGFSWMGILDKVLIVVVSVGVISGFWFAGSPSQQRAVRFDEQRVSDLITIQYQVTNYWQTKQKLPQNLGELTSGVDKFIAPKDPETGSDYVYRITLAPLSFELCAVFTTSNLEEAGASRSTGPVGAYYSPESENWSHGVGETCFDKTIDPDFFPPLTK